MSVANRNYCRFCAELKTVDEIYNLTVYSSIRSLIHEKLVFFNITCIDLAAEDALPKTICFECYKNFEKAHNFILQIKLSQSILNNLFIENGVKLYSLFHENQNEESKANLKNKNAKKIKHENIDCKFYTEHEIEIKVETAECAPNYSDVSSLGVESPDSPLSSLDVDNNLVFYCGIPVFQPDQPIDERLDKKIDKSWTGYPWQCQNCNECFTDMHLLREHFKSAHDICSGYKCTDCGESFTVFELFVEHATGHRPHLRNYCQYCNIKLEPACQEKHKNKHYKEKNCQHCGKVFNSARYWREHISKYQPKSAKINTNAEVKKKRKRSKPVYVLPVSEIEKINDKSWTGYPWVCGLCDGSFPNVVELREHSKETHGKCFALKCVDCSEHLDGYRRFVFHVRRHRPYLKSYCHYCNANFGSDSEINHVAEHFSASQRLCEGCGEIFHDKTQLKRHKDIYKPIQPQHIPYIRRECPVSVDDLTCDVCNKICVNGNSLRQHKTLHTERKKEFTCDRCGNAFYSKGSLESHLLAHESASVTCEICKKAFKSALKLKYHVQTHFEVRQYECDICTRKFKRKCQLRDHFIIHTDEMPYPCSYCGKAFKRKNNLVTHERQHTGARPYACTECTMDFTNWANCDKHMKRKHGTTLAQSVMTPNGKLPLNPNSGKPKKIRDLETVKEWTDQVLAPKRKGKKLLKANPVAATNSVAS